MRFLTFTPSAKNLARFAERADAWCDILTDVQAGNFIAPEPAGNK